MLIIPGHHFLPDCFPVFAELFGKVHSHAHEDECVSVGTGEVDNDFSVGLFCAYHTPKYTDIYEVNHLISFKIFESKKSSPDSEKIIKDLKEEYGVKVDPDFSLSDLKLIEKAFSLFEKSLIKGKIKEIKSTDMGAVHGTWDGEKGKIIRLNPSIFSFKREFENGIKGIPYKLFIVVHEIAHSIDQSLAPGKKTFSDSDKWKEISGWKEFERKNEVPKGYERYIEKRPGRSVDGFKKAAWIYKEDADFCRRYSTKSPREDFADSIAFGVFKDWDRFKGKGGKEKMRIVREILRGK